MFNTVANRFQQEEIFAGGAGPAGVWELKRDQILETLERSASGNPLILLGAAFSFVQLLDFLRERSLRFDLPRGSRILETGGYKGRSRVVSRAALYEMMEETLGVPADRIISEYGMSELSSQAYDYRYSVEEFPAQKYPRALRFPPWARVQIVSPETGAEVSIGETGMIRVFDLANLYSVMAIQTEDLGIRREEGFELVGRTSKAEPRGCSLMISA
jgi:hypothetical protein